MGVNILERIQAKIELFRLEQRYTRRRHRRSTFVSNATYVDGEYIYNTPNTTGSSSATTSDSSTASASSSSPSPRAAAGSPRNRLNRWSSMPGFGSMSKASGGPRLDATVDEEPQRDWRAGRYSASYAR